MPVSPEIVVTGLSRASHQGKLHIGPLHFACAVGRAGRAFKFGEGDGITPVGRWPIRHVFFRPDRMERPHTDLPVSGLQPRIGWCDAPGDANYNRMIRLPYPASHERLWRRDHLYDVIVVVGFNDYPRARGRGSAIFIHLARAGYRPTEGCIALSRRDMIRFLALARRDSFLTVR